MKTCIITGASSGIGKQTALKLKKEGFNVVGTYLNSTESAKQLTELGIDMLRCNASCYGDLERVFKFAKQKYSGVDVVIANAGVAPPQKLLLDTTEEELKNTLSVNLLGVAYTNKLATINMLSDGGIIINVSSVFGLQGGSCEAIYSASKAGVIGFTRALAEELSNSSIKVVSLALGLIDTPMNSHLSTEDKLEFAREMGFDYIPTASEVADEIFTLISNGVENGKTYKLFMKG